MFLDSREPRLAAPKNCGEPPRWSAATSGISGWFIPQNVGFRWFSGWVYHVVWCLLMFCRDQRITESHITNVVASVPFGMTCCWNIGMLECVWEINVTEKLCSKVKPRSVTRQQCCSCAVLLWQREPETWRVLNEPIFVRKQIQPLSLGPSGQKPAETIDCCIDSVCETYFLHLAHGCLMIFKQVPSSQQSASLVMWWTDTAVVLWLIGSPWVWVVQ